MKYLFPFVVVDDGAAGTAGGSVSFFYMKRIIHKHNEMQRTVNATSTVFWCDAIWPSIFILWAITWIMLTHSMYEFSPNNKKSMRNAIILATTSNDSWFWIIFDLIVWLALQKFTFFAIISWLATEVTEVTTQRLATLHCETERQGSQWAYIYL